MATKLILKRPLNYGGRIFSAGENVRGILPSDLFATLQERDAFEEVQVESNENGEQSTTLPVSPQALAVNDLADYVGSVTDPTEIERLLQAEKETENPRASAIKLFEKRMKELANE
jgi:hypothetical protein